MPEEPFDQRRRRAAEAQARLEARLAATTARLAELRRQAAKRRDADHRRLTVQLRQFRSRMGPGPGGRPPLRKPRRDPEAGGVPAVPDRPKNLSGGAAAELEFERE
jgi:hypothetical protein